VKVITIEKKQTDNINYTIVIVVLILNFLIVSISYSKRYNVGLLSLIHRLITPSFSINRAIYIACFIIVSHPIIIKNIIGINKFKTSFDDPQSYSIVASLSIMSAVGISLDIILDEGMTTSTILFIISLIVGVIGGYMIHEEFKDRTYMKIQEYYEYFSLIYPPGIIIALILSFFVKAVIKNKNKNK